MDLFSDGYKDVIQQTPHIVYKTSLLIWIFLVLLLGLLGAGLTVVLVR
ncbi:hypothetical protein [Fuerstiella marisgermanici]|nr:hypothetical protein [Fuerstiella marisgermanici]